MSWCRWSTVCENNCSSDLYIYESDYGVEVHIAVTRLLNEDKSPALPSFWECPVEEWIKARETRVEWERLNSKRVNIDLPHAGETFIFDSEDKNELTLFLNKLRDLGYYFPSYIYDYLEDECK